jgi:hypothetical protein
MSIGIGFLRHNRLVAEADAEKRQSKIRTTFITDYCYVPFWDLYCLWLRYFLNK